MGRGCVLPPCLQLVIAATCVWMTRKKRDIDERSGDNLHMCGEYVSVLMFVACITHLFGFNPRPREGGPSISSRRLNGSALGEGIDWMMRNSPSTFAN